jgi:hypothetical protein
MSKQNEKTKGGRVLFFLLLVLIFGATGCTNITTNPDMNIIQPKLISRDRAKMLSDTFVNKFQSCDKEVQTYAWFSSEELHNYFLYANQIAKNQNITPSGMRVYFGVYPSADGDKAGKLTVFFSPTQAVSRNGVTTHEDIIIGNNQNQYLLNFGNMGYPPNAYGH